MEHHTDSGDPRRYFSETERRALFLASDGKCARCGNPLGPGWHADHIDPHIKGGPTDVINGQALCAPCNLKKGSKTLELRDWQQEALNHYMIESRRNEYLVEATPGAGKTQLAIAVADRLLLSRSVERIFVVVPSVNLKQQWTDKAHEAGIDLEPKWVSGWPSDMHGIVLTYQQVTYAASTLRALASQQRSLVIFDEIHHCNENAEWGQALRHAFEHGWTKLALSGTPFRSDSQRIPFIPYVEDQGAPDIRYGYEKGLKDGVVRSLFFPRQGGTTKWIGNDGREYNANFDDPLAKQQSSERLRTALHPSGDWLRQTLEDAHVRLAELRSGECPEAGGIVFALNQEHARKIAAMLRSITGADPQVVVSEDPEASSTLRRLATSKDPWIVSVRMVSEGVDIPRLRVAVYATNITTQMFFRQAAGRVVRTYADDPDPTAVMYFPDDPILRSYAEKITKVVNANIDEQQERFTQERSNAEESLPLFTPLASDAEHRGVIVDGETVSPVELERARMIKLRRASTAAWPDEVVALLLRDAGPAPVSSTQAKPKERLTDQKRTMRKQGTTVLRKVHYKYEIPFQDVMYEANQRAGIQKLDTASLEQLQVRYEIAQKWLSTGAIS